MSQLSFKIESGVNTIKLFSSSTIFFLLFCIKIGHFIAKTFFLCYRKYNLTAKFGNENNNRGRIGSLWEKSKIKISFSNIKRKVFVSTTIKSPFNPWPFFNWSPNYLQGSISPSFVCRAKSCWSTAFSRIFAIQLYQHFFTLKMLSFTK